MPATVGVIQDILMMKMALVLHAILNVLNVLELHLIV